MTTAQERWLISASRQFTASSVCIASVQILNTLLPLLGLLLLLAARPSIGLGVLLSPLLGGLIIRCFVLQHDAGHGSFLPSRTASDLVGGVLSVLTGVPFEAWRTEHAWHHANQGKLHARGIDRVNSPMTVTEARERPDLAQQRAARIRPWRVLILGAAAILITRKTTADFFMFRPGFPGPRPDTAAIARSVRLTVAAHLGLHALLAAWVGPLVWLVTAVLAWSTAGMIGALLFWLQHNAERTWFAGAQHWSPARVALQGSTHLVLPWPLRWLTADIGLHHAHHLNYMIPNYRLRAAVAAIPELARVPALTASDVRASFTHVFWDSRRERMVPLEEV